MECKQDNTVYKERGVNAQGQTLARIKFEITIQDEQMPFVCGAQ